MIQRRYVDRRYRWLVIVCVLLIVGLSSLPVGACQSGEWLECGHPRVHHYVAQFTQPSWRSWLLGVWDRFSFYSNHVQEAISRHGLPQALGLIPVVESAYRPEAVSSRGAVGLWQITRIGAVGYPLLIGEPIDERRDFWKSTEVALKTLSANYDRFNDWLLAIAAYNAGPTGVQRAINRYGSKDFWKLRSMGYLPQQTGEFVPRILAVVHIFNHWQRYRLPEPKPIVWVRVGAGGRADLRKIALITGMDLSLLRIANAELSSSFTPSYPRTPVEIIGSDDERSGEMLGYWLKVPKNDAETVRATLEKRTNLFEFIEHRVRSGETFWDMARLYGSTVKLIIDENPDLTPQGLRIGETVIIPLLAGGSTPPLSQNKLEWVQRSGFGAVHVVTSGDSLWEIAQAYQTTVELIVQINGLSLEDFIKPGEVLMIPIGSGASQIPSRFR